MKLKQHIQESGERLRVFYMTYLPPAKSLDVLMMRGSSMPVLTELISMQAQSHNRTLDILIEWHKGEMKGYEVMEKETPYYSVNENMRKHQAHNQAHQQAIDYLEASKTNHED